MSSSTDIVNIVARLVVITALFLFGSLSNNQVQAQQIEFADQDIQTPILITGQQGNFWNQGHYEIW